MSNELSIFYAGIEEKSRLTQIDKSICDFMCNLNKEKEESEGSFRGCCGGCFQGEKIEKDKQGYTVVERPKAGQLVFALSWDSKKVIPAEILEEMSSANGEGQTRFWYSWKNVLTGEMEVGSPTFVKFDSKEKEFKEKLLDRIEKRVKEEREKRAIYTQKQFWVSVDICSHYMGILEWVKDVIKELS